MCCSVNPRVSYLALLLDGWSNKNTVQYTGQNRVGGIVKQNTLPTEYWVNGAMVNNEIHTY